MAYGTEIQAKLGIDTSSVGKDLAGAKKLFDDWGREIVPEAEKTGASYSEKLTKGITGKLAGSGAIATALGTALGLNLPALAAKITAAIVDGTKEGWEEAGKIADENAKLIAEKFREGLSPKQATDQLQKELKKAVAELESIKPEIGFIPDDSGLTEGKTFTKDLNAEQLTAQQNAQKKILEIEKQLRDLKKDEARDLKEYEEARKKFELEELSDGAKIVKLNEMIAATVAETLKGDLTAGELAKKKINLLELEKTLRETLKRITEEDSKLIKDDIERKEKADKEEIARAEKKFSIERARYNQSKKLADDQGKLSDRSKLTVGELANLDGKKKEFSLGKSNLDLSFNDDQDLTEQQREQKKKARQIQELEAEAEQKRLSGDRAGAEEVFNRVGTLRNDLVASGATKSTEGDKFEDLRKQIAEDNKEITKTLKDLLTVESGKFVSQ